MAAPNWKNGTFSLDATLQAIRKKATLALVLPSIKALTLAGDLKKWGHQQKKRGILKPKLLVRGMGMIRVTLHYQAPVGKRCPQGLHQDLNPFCH